MIDEPARLNKLLADRLGIARRKADEAIRDGRVRIDGRIAVVGERIDPERHQIVFDDKVIPSRNITPAAFAFYKPQGYVTTLHTARERGKPISDLLPTELGLKPAGRLDTDSEGLLIVTNDGDLIQKITHPKFELEKEYRVIIRQTIDAVTLHRLQGGVELEDGWCQPDRVQKAGNRELTIVLHEGRKREIRRLMGAVGFQVERLIRVRIAGVHLDDLAVGTLRSLNDKEMSSLLKIK